MPLVFILAVFVTRGEKRETARIVLTHYLLPSPMAMDLNQKRKGDTCSIRVQIQASPIPDKVASEILPGRQAKKPEGKQENFFACLIMPDLATGDRLDIQPNIFPTVVAALFQLGTHAPSEDGWAPTATSPTQGLPVESCLSP